ncbi:hypothetical protein O4H56_12030 [Pseudomonas anguilliseptica]|nr:hypothetical protein [Pseudomonas anguilliseptica]MCZ4322768.1 hypothetical protein [Pseudomonas anguilliseptica]
MQFGVDLRTAGDQVKLADIARIKAIAFDVDLPAFDIKAIQTPAFDNRLAGAEGHARCIDKAATVAADAMRVSYDDRCGLAGHFGVALELTGATAVDLIEDDIRRPTLEVGVTHHIAAQLRLHYCLGAVVENQALLTDVEVGEFVMRQATAIGRGDIDHGHAISCLGYRGIAAGLGIQRQFGRRRNNRVKEQYADQDTGNVLEKWRANVHVLTPTRRAIKQKSEKSEEQVDPEIHRTLLTLDGVRAFQ